MKLYPGLRSAPDRAEDKDNPYKKGAHKDGLPQPP